ncbi:RagB/SusD family nutrient uptake outer membrane protein [Kaistella flava (ex Peng et al. 2021)]|uniref:RagB/SusD family nutrient uptake outer membrane protein n=1 Tax=Kaistella flava (ex Peng et al. 2021) TaxID=2038776 RepID=A0A7M2Y8I1_9FLAO|nr:RagB/SusD family nutrient uptake outer membrane protein [Kaistella flava (ex Peng et al. 2021)]QOW10406.1 RagB/SusD family nutrient uptake outer membrane protein [Kaistella flava (ex Peng et al. 2021)]
MKKYKLLSAFVIIALMASSCREDFLKPYPTSAVSAENYFQNESQLLAGVINMYDGIQGANALEDDDKKNQAVQFEYYLTEMRSDNTRTKSSEGEASQFEKYTVVATNGIVADYYISYYNIIFRANTVLAHLDVASETTRPKFEGEAKFVRAYANFNLVRLFGDIPYVDHVLSINEKDVQFTRVPQAQIYALIVSDLKSAIETLDNSYKNRASKAAAQALLAKVYLTLKTNYLEAQQLCESVMASNYSLETNFKDVFFNENNKEIIFSIGYVADNKLDSQGFSAEWLNSVGRSSGVNYVTNEARAALDLLGGNRKPYSYRQDPSQPSQYQVVKYLPVADAALGIQATASSPRMAGNDWIVIRYADVLLMHVEAIMAGNNETNSSSALNSFAKIRLRAGLLPDSDGIITRQELLDERRVEFAFENQRFFDLVRFNEAQNVLSAYSSSNGYSFTTTDLLLPIPQREINISGGLMKQNPGY